MKLSGLLERAVRIGVRGKRGRGSSAIAGGGLRCFVVAMCCCSVDQMQAAISSVAETVSLAPQYAGFGSVPLSFQKFDSSLGQLSSVEIILQGTGQFTQRYENTAERADSARMKQTINLMLTLPDADKPLLKAKQVENHRYSVSGYDGVIDFEGTSGVSGFYDVTAEDDKVLTSKKNLAQFTGSGLADIFLSTRAPFHISGVGQSSAFEVQALTGADITIIYNYVAAPEPIWFGAAAGGVALVLGRRWWGKKV